MNSPAWIKKSASSIQPYWDKARSAYANLSTREQQWLIGAALIVLVLTVLAVVQPVKNIFSDQAFTLEAAERNAQEVAANLAKYQRLVQRRAEVERDFQSVEIKEGALSHLEALIRDKAGINQGAFTIKDQAPKPFGNNYQQTFFSVTFSTTDYGRLIDFLQELVEGPKPLVLKRLSVKRSRGGDKLEVDLEISSITKER